MCAVNRRALLYLPCVLGRSLFEAPAPMPFCACAFSCVHAMCIRGENGVDRVVKDNEGADGVHTLEVF